MSKVSVRPKAGGFEARVRINGEQYSRWSKREEDALARIEALLWARQPPQLATLSWFMDAHAKAASLRSEGYADQARWTSSKVSHLLDREIETVTRTEIQQTFNFLAQSLSSASLSIVKKHLSAAWEIALDDGAATRNVVSRVTLPKSTSQARSLAPLDPAELLALTEAARGLMCHTHVVYCGFLGLRPGEVSRSQIIKGCLTIEGTKTKGSRRIVPLPEAVLAEVAANRIPGAHNKDNLRRSMQVAVRRSGVRDPKDFWPYLLRHTAATGLQQVGCPEDGRARILGHAKATITSHYSHADLEIYRPFVEAWASLVYSSGGNPCGKLLEEQGVTPPQKSVLLNLKPNGRSGEI